MNPENPISQTQPAPSAPSRKELSIRIFGVGNAGCNVLQHLLLSPPPGVTCVGVNTEPLPPASAEACKTIVLEDKLLRGLGTGGDPERGRSLAEEQSSQIQPLCEGADLVFVIAGLGGGAGTGIAPVIARTAKDAGALCIAFVVLPFDCEGRRRAAIAREGLEHLREIADGLVTLPNQRVFEWIDENTTVRETFRTVNEFIAEGLRGLWRLIVQPGLIEIHFSDIAALLRDRHSESVFAVAEGLGPTRSREVTDKLLAHPMLSKGQLLKDAGAVLVSVLGGPDLTMAEVNRVMRDITQLSEGATIVMGAAVDEAFQDRLSITLIAARKQDASDFEPRTHSAEQLDSQLLSCAPSVRPGSRIVPPPPTLGPEQMKQLLESRPPASGRKKASSRFRQAQLPLEIVSKGRFDKSEPTIHKGEDLDVPTYIRRGISLN